MATTTPNYGWPVPTSTDLVKDGAVAIEALGDAIDASVFAGAGSGLVLINDTTVTAQAAVNIDNLFTSTYANYRVMIKYNGAVASMNLEARGGGSTQTGNFFTAVYGYTYNGLTQGVFQTNTQAFSMNGGYTTDRGAQSIDIFNPQLATPTVFQSNSAGESYWIGSSLNLNTSVVTGLRISTASGTFSANIRVYGYRN